jgi:hypothetical protein
MPLALVLDFEQWTTVLDGKLSDYHNCPEDLAVPPDVGAVYFLEDPLHLKLPIDCLVARLDAGLHPLILGGVAWVIRALDLVGSTDVAVVGLGALAQLGEVTKDPLLKILMSVNSPAR